MGYYVIALFGILFFDLYFQTVDYDYYKGSLKNIFIVLEVCWIYIFLDKQKDFDEHIVNNRIMNFFIDTRGILAAKLFSGIFIGIMWATSAIQWFKSDYIGYITPIVFTIILIMCRFKWSWSDSLVEKLIEKFEAETKAELENKYKIKLIQQSKTGFEWSFTLICLAVAFYQVNSYLYEMGLMIEYNSPPGGLFCVLIAYITLLERQIKFELRRLKGHSSNIAK